MSTAGAGAKVRAEDFAQLGDLTVVVAGIPFGQSGSTNNLRVIRIGGGDNGSGIFSGLHARASATI